MNTKQVAFGALELACVAMALDKDPILYNKAFKLRALLRVDLNIKEIEKGEVWASKQHRKALRDVD